MQFKRTCTATLKMTTIQTSLDDCTSTDSKTPGLRHMIGLVGLSCFFFRVCVCLERFSYARSEASPLQSYIYICYVEISYVTPNNTAFPIDSSSLQLSIDFTPISSSFTAFCLQTSKGSHHFLQVSQLRNWYRLSTNFLQDLTALLRSVLNAEL